MTSRCRRLRADGGEARRRAARRAAMAVRAEMGRLSLPRVQGRRATSTCGRRRGSRSTAIFPRSSRRCRRCRRRVACSTARSSCPSGGALSFDELLMRIHPAASRVQKLARASIRRCSSCSISWSTCVARRWSSCRSPSAAPALEQFAARAFGASAPRCGCRRRRDAPQRRRAGSPRSAASSTASIAKRSRLPYRSGDAPACRKSSGCARPTASSAAFATDPQAAIVGSLLLGLYDDEACSITSASRRTSRAERS